MAVVSSFGLTSPHLWLKSKEYPLAPAGLFTDETYVLQDEFPISSNCAFFNHAGMAPLPRGAADAILKYMHESSYTGFVQRAQLAERFASTRELVAQMTGCTAADVAFCANTTTAISFVANGLDWRPGDNVVLANVEYPANVYPWWAQAARGVALKFVSPKNERLTPEDYIAAIDDSTRVVTVSHVQFANGTRLDLEPLGRFCHERGIAFVVDAIQSCGVLPIDMAQSRISALCCGSHKWLLCPPGIAFFCCEKGFAERLHVWGPGSDSVKRGPSYLDYALEYREGPRRFESGSLAIPCVYALEAMLMLLHGVGEAAIAAKVKSLTDRLCSGLEARGCTVHSPRGSGEWSGIVAFTHRAHGPGEIVNTLQAKGVITCVREGRVRVSPHFYNTNDEIDRLLEALP